MADNRGQKVQAFRDVLRDNRKIALTHNGERYKAKSVIEVLYSSRIEGEEACYHCGNAATSICVVVASTQIIFLVQVLEGCMTYDPTYNPTVIMTSFNTREELHQHLLKRAQAYKQVLEALFPPPPCSSSSSSTDSY